MPARVKNRRRGYTRVSAKHQVTIPIATLRDAGIRTGDTLRAEVRGPGEVLLIRAGAGDTWAQAIMPSVLYPLADFGSLYPDAGGRAWATELREKVDLTIDPSTQTWDQALMAIARFARTLSTLLASGVALLGAMDIVKAVLAAAIVDENCARDDRRRCHAVVGLDHGIDAVRGQHLERRSLRGSGQRVGVLAHVDRAADARVPPNRSSIARPCSNRKCRAPWRLHRNASRQTPSRSPETFDAPTCSKKQAPSSAASL